MRIIVLCTAGIFIGAIVRCLPLGSSHPYSTASAPADPTAYASALLVMIAVSLLACWNPASRAVRIDPAQTLRGE
jgi:ABC-type lipoprotein release transport system permease subunit